MTIRENPIKSTLIVSNIARHGKNSRKPEFQFGYWNWNLLSDVRAWLKHISRTWKGLVGLGRGTRLKPSRIPEKKKDNRYVKCFIMRIFISNIVHWKSNIINIDIHEQLISIVSKHHFKPTNQKFDSDLLITPFSNIDDQFSLQSFRLWSWMVINDFDKLSLHVNHRAGPYITRSKEELWQKKKLDISGIVIFPEFESNKYFYMK